MPRTRSLAWSELKIGILAVLALLLAGLMIFLVGGQGGFFWQRYHLKTKFANVQGLKSGGLVRVAGVEVGQVKKIEFQGSEVEVTMEVRGFVPSAKTPGSISDVAAGASEGIDELTKLLKEVRAGKGTVGKLVTDEQLYKELNAFLGSAENVVNSVNRGKGTLGQLVNDPAAYKSLQASLNNLSEMTRRINAGEGSLGQLVKDDAFAKSLSSTTSASGWRAWSIV